MINKYVVIIFTLFTSVMTYAKPHNYVLYKNRQNILTASAQLMSTDKYDEGKYSIQFKSSVTHVKKVVNIGSWT